jgi:plasmid stability protein
MRRKQLYLTDELDDRLRMRAEEEERSEAAVVRDALTLYLETGAAPVPDPILGLAGIGRQNRDRAEAG